MTPAASKLAEVMARAEDQAKGSEAQPEPENLSLKQRETSEFIADMILELRNMAKSARLYTVMVPLEYAYYEAFSVANKVHVSPEEVERLRALSQVSRESPPAMAKAVSE